MQQVWSPVRLLLALLFVALLHPVFESTLAAAPTVEKIDFDSQIAPLLKAHCIECHGPDSDDGGLRWDSKPSALLGGDSGVPAIVPGSIAKSELIRRLTTDDDSEQMPPEDEGEPLSTEQVALLKSWIEQGADWPAAEEEKPPHWAYVVPVRPEMPAVKRGDWGHNPIDRFVLAQLEQQRLAPNPPATRERLLRRVSLDLTGLPPTLGELEAFLSDKSANAYEKAVDRMLASPRYGERWAQRWLDLARYADSNGFQRDGFRTMWAYRDYVIKSFNADKPFDQFAIEQLAGDLLPKPSAEQLTATGFQRCTTVNVEAGVNQEENRVNQIFDRVNVTGTVFLGTTFECCQCHNHKYDPFTQREYYQMYAFFNNTPLETKFRSKGDTAGLDFTAAPLITLPVEGEQLQAKEALQAKYEELKAEWEKRRSAAAQGFAQWDQTQSERVSRDSWLTVAVEQFKAEHQVKHELLKDGSLLLGGPNPDKNRFTVVTTVDRRDIGAIKLEALTHKSLPNNGPGRHATPNSNFVLTGLTLSVEQPDGTQRELELHEAKADYFAANFHPARALDGNDATGWAIHSEFGKPHWATFLLKQPLQAEGPVKLTFQMTQNYGERRTLGRIRMSVAGADASSATLPEHVVKVLRVPQAKRSTAQRNGLRDYFLESQPELRKMRDEMTKMEGELDSLQGPTTLVMRELDNPRMTNLLKRGSFENKGIEVTAGVPAALNQWPESEPVNRLGLARWITADENPLFARVTVNRWWSAFFGRGLVATPEDLGTQSTPPTHPELLDWLAVEFRENGWSMKHVHKLIVTSATYRQAATHRADLREHDPLNLHYARGPRGRLPAEMVRDNALAISGLLHHELGGPPVKPPQPPKIWRVTGRVDNNYQVSSEPDRYRRGVYVIWRRSAPYPSFVNFDAPDRSSCVVERPQTNTPLQALTLLNDAVYVEAAMALAAHVLIDQPTADVAERITYATRRAVARPPTAEELALLTELFEEELARHRADPSKANTLANGAPLPAALRAQKLPADQLAAWYYVCTVLLNLDESITK